MSSNRMLSGESSEGTLIMRAPDGSLANPNEAIFPIVAFDNAGKIVVIGTGFFISSNGLFVTAAHVKYSTTEAK